MESNTQSTQQDDRNKPAVVRFGHWLWGIALNKAAEAVLVAVFGLLAAYCGATKYWPQLFASEESTASTAVVAEKTKPEEGFVIGKDNVGYKRTPKYGGFSSDFKILDPGDHKAEAPFTEVKSGKQRLKWSVMTTVTSGGYVMGIGGTKSYWKTEGELDCVISQTTLYALLKAGKEKFLAEGLLPIIRKQVAKTLDDKMVKRNDGMIQELDEAASPLIAKELDEHLSIADATIKIASVSQLKEAERERPDVETIDGGTMTREVNAPPKVENVGWLMGPLLFVAAVFLLLLLLQLFSIF